MKTDLQLFYELFCHKLSFDIAGRNRTKPFPYYRYIFFYHAKKKTGSSLASIGRVCGNRDHATVLHGLRKYDDLEKDTDFRIAKLYIEEKVFGINNDGEKIELEKIKILEAENKKLIQQFEESKEILKLKGLISEVADMFSTLPEEAFKEAIDTRLKPFVKMYQSRVTYQSKKAG